MLVKQKGGYQISQLYKDYCNPISDAEKQKFLLVIFQSPKLYSDLIEKFDGHAVPAELKTHLIRFHKITESAAPAAAEVFLASAKSVGVLSDSNVLSYKQKLQALGSPNVQYAEVIIEDKPQANGNEQNNGSENYSNPDAGQPKTTYLLTDGATTDQRLRIPLSGKREAFLQYPSDINSKDIKILLKQIELLELTLE